MAILERVIEKVVDQQWDAVNAQEKEWDALEAKLGSFGKKRRYMSWIGEPGVGYVVFEREWESMAAYEAAYGRLWALPEVESLNKVSSTLKVDTRIELYLMLE